MAFCTQNHRFLVAVGRWFETLFNERKCNSDLGDEYHYLLVCKNFDNKRKQYLKPYFYTRPNVLKYFEIMHTNKDTLLKQLHVCRFIDILLRKYVDMEQLIEYCTM